MYMHVYTALTLGCPLPLTFALAFHSPCLHGELSCINNEPCRVCVQTLSQRRQMFEHLALLNGTTVEAVRGQSAAKDTK